MRLTTVAALDACSAIERLAMQLILRLTVFGVRSERGAGQADLFDAQVELPVPSSSMQRISGRGRPAQPQYLPRVSIVYEFDQAERAQFASLRPIGEETSETLEFTPAR
ncbi:MAG: hypothetical protein ABIP08_00605, partial [Lautropia sp.]